MSFRWAPSRAHGPVEADDLPEAHGPPKVHGPRGHSPPAPLSAALNGYKNNYLLVIYCLKKFFCEHECEKKCASPTKSLTACHCYLVTAKSQKRKKQLYYPYTFFKPNFTSGLFWACFDVQTICWVWARTCRPVYNFEITATIIRLQEHHAKGK